MLSQLVSWCASTLHVLLIANFKTNQKFAILSYNLRDYIIGLNMFFLFVSRYRLSGNILIIPTVLQIQLKTLHYKRLQSQILNKKPVFNWK